jgi:WhiB family transcriptional regulator, redox-sensing transcriptional regulator
MERVSSRRPAGCARAAAVPAIADGDWRILAECRFTDPDLFFPVSSTGSSLLQVAAAKAICARCAVQPECLTFALRTRQVHGIWGGRTEQERYQAARTDDPADRSPAVPRQRSSSAD